MYNFFRVNPSPRRPNTISTENEFPSIRGFHVKYYHQRLSFQQFSSASILIPDNIIEISLIIYWKYNYRINDFVELGIVDYGMERMRSRVSGKNTGTPQYDNWVDEIATSSNQRTVSSRNDWAVKKFKSPLPHFLKGELFFLAPRWERVRVREQLIFILILYHESSTRVYSEKLRVW